MAARGMWPTPVASSGGRGIPNDAIWVSANTLERQDGTKVTVDLQQAVRRWPTPVASSGGRSIPSDATWASANTLRRPNGTQVTIDLEQAVRRWPTPTVKGDYNRAGLSPRSGDGLATAVATMGQAGQLSPRWVCLLQGFPADWTELGPTDGRMASPAPQSVSRTASTSSALSATP